MEFQYHGKSYTITLERKRIKNINLRVRSDGTIYISAPMHVKQEAILQALEKHAAGLTEASDRMRKKKEPDFSDGSMVMHLGREIRLRWSEKPCKSVLTDDTLTIFAGGSQANAAHAFRMWSVDECVKLCKTLNTEVCNAFRKAGYPVPLARIEIKEMTSRWGSCTAKSGRISMNFRLMQYPEGCIRSVFYHEYTHFIHQNHSKEFYAVLLQMCPDYDKWDTILKGKEC